MTDKPQTNGSGPSILRPQEAKLLHGLLWEIKKVIVGHEQEVEQLVVCLLAGGHCLIEGLPGVAKTLAVRTLADAMGAGFTRIQFTPDLMPSDIVGTRVYRASSEKFDVELGPVFTNFLLADEINRAPAKVQAAMLEVMAERQVSIGGQTWKLKRPFMVLATQNPVETVGVYPLPEAERDRFLLQIRFSYPGWQEELEIVRRMTSPMPGVEKILSAKAVVALQNIADGIYVDPAVMEYTVALVMATRDPKRYGPPDIAPYLAYGASPRASLGLIQAARALALMQGRGYIVPDDVHALAMPVLRHRLILTYEALADHVSSDDIVKKVLAHVPQPTRGTSRRASRNAHASGRT